MTISMKFLLFYITFECVCLKFSSYAYAPNNDNIYNQKPLNEGSKRFSVKSRRKSLGGFQQPIYLNKAMMQAPDNMTSSSVMPSSPGTEGPPSLCNGLTQCHPCVTAIEDGKPTCQWDNANSICSQVPNTNQSNADAHEWANTNACASVKEITPRYIDPNATDIWIKIQFNGPMPCISCPMFNYTVEILVGNATCMNATDFGAPWTEAIECMLVQPVEGPINITYTQKNMQSGQTTPVKLRISSSMSTIIGNEPESVFSLFDYLVPFTGLIIVSTILLVLVQVTPMCMRKLKGSGKKTSSQTDFGMSSSPAQSFNTQPILPAAKSATNLANDEPDI